MEYRYKKGQLFKKKLDVPKKILDKVYNHTLSLDEFYKYQLDDKIPISCIIDADRRIIEKFGIEKCRNLDFDLLDYMLRNASKYDLKLLKCAKYIKIDYLIFQKILRLIVSNTFLVVVN